MKLLHIEGIEQRHLLGGNNENIEIQGSGILTEDGYIGVLAGVTAFIGIEVFLRYYFAALGKEKKGFIPDEIGDRLVFGFCCGVAFGVMTYDILVLLPKKAVNNEIHGQ